MRVYRRAQIESSLGHVSATLVVGSRRCGHLRRFPVSQILPIFRGGGSVVSRSRAVQRCSSSRIEGRRVRRVQELVAISSGISSVGCGVSGLGLVIAVIGGNHDSAHLLFSIGDDGLTRCELLLMRI
jgi:hypothetical protein